ncbi:MAG TPA: GH92 family glycosyl hydrolase, partial [Flavisolibacter sp.]|nr:GH92 family glycosyl hydrolase [Flavisolibacter sp.]
MTRMRLLLMFLVRSLMLFFPFVLWVSARAQNTDRKYISYVKPLIGTHRNGQITPVAVSPFGMVQVGPDTHLTGSGYRYRDSTILGFSHIHKSGGGCSDFLDILFQPTTGAINYSQGREGAPGTGYQSRFSHQNEVATAGFYSVKLLDYGIDVSLTASEHCAFHKYDFSSSESGNVIIDLSHGSTSACTVFSEFDKDTVITSGLSIVNKYAVQGHRISSGWAPRQEVFFYAEFSEPIMRASSKADGSVTNDFKEVSGKSIQGAFTFRTKGNRQLYVKVGISTISHEMAKRNMYNEIRTKTFNAVKLENEKRWEAELSKMQVEGGTKEQKEIFYTALYHTFMYPMLSSETGGFYRGADRKVYKAEGYRHYSGVMGLWDVFRASLPLLSLLNPGVARDHVKTFLSHYKQAGLLPSWVLYGNETLCMIGYHSMPVIADVLYKGIGKEDARELFSAMKATANKDTFGIGTIWKKPYGTVNYKKYNYIPADLEDNSVSQTLEFAYDDWCIAQVAKMLGAHKDHEHFMKRSASYKNLFDPSSTFMRGRFKDGSWTQDFDPLYYDHMRTDFCEGTSWVWTFFVPHDIAGLANQIGGTDKLAAKLDRFFTLETPTKDGTLPLPMEGKIGQYIHGNEPSHHIAFMYNEVGQPWKTQKYVKQILNSFYKNTPDGLCGDDDTGQMSAWYIFGAMGFYPVTHGTGVYSVGSPVFPKMKIIRHTPEGKKVTLH